MERAGSSSFGLYANLSGAFGSSHHASGTYATGHGFDLPDDLDDIFGIGGLMLGDFDIDVLADEGVASGDGDKDGAVGIAESAAASPGRKGADEVGDDGDCCAGVIEIGGGGGSLRGRGSSGVWGSQTGLQRSETPVLPVGGAGEWMLFNDFSISPVSVASRCLSSSRKTQQLFLSMIRLDVIVTAGV